MFVSSDTQPLDNRLVGWHSRVIDTARGNHMNRVYFTHESIEYAFISPFLYRLDGQRLNKVEFKDASDSLKAAVEDALSR
ncbi:hypothetical protein [Leptolyngbya phage Lbo240-yong1]|uniref:Uncharacterized protein n=1 Tax=Leptolyngbya phage Lbo240-yong1 TaxID=2928836 RepID=A0A9X9H2K6_9CAUD|nr:hypothetical protein [Leptolyngbya phage Lbo240-yong1]